MCGWVHVCNVSMGTEKVGEYQGGSDLPGLFLFLVWSMQRVLGRRMGLQLRIRLHGKYICIHEHTLHGKYSFTCTCIRTQTDKQEYAYCVHTIGECPSYSIP